MPPKLQNTQPKFDTRNSNEIPNKPISAINEISIPHSTENPFLPETKKIASQTKQG